MKTQTIMFTATLGVMLLSGMLYGSLAHAQMLYPEYGQGFDLSACEWECKLRYGLWPLADGLDNDLQFKGYYGYSTCIQRCNNTYWKSFDKQSEELFD